VLYFYPPISEERKVEKFAEAFMDVTSITFALNNKKEKCVRD
jgi:hypothetical protein